MIKRLFKLSLFAAALLALAACGFTLWLCHQQALIFAYPPRQPARYTPDDFSIQTWQQVQFATGDGLNLQGWYIPPQPGSGTIIFVHGHGSNRGQLLAEAAWLANEG